MSDRPPNHWDSMLAWLSTEAQHKWTNVKARCMRLSAIDPPGSELTPYGHAIRWVDPLIRLGHAEFDPDGRTVSAISAGIVLRGSPDTGICYGYWDPARLRTLRGYEFRHLLHSPQRGPTCRALGGTPEQFSEFADEADVWLADDPSLDLLRRLPLLSCALSDLPPIHLASTGFWERYDFRSNQYGAWRNSPQPPIEPGLYRHREGQMVRVFVAEDHRPYKLETPDQTVAAKWWCYSSRLPWVYNLPSRRLLIPYGTPELPVLVSRGLTAMSARLATRVEVGGARWWQYVAVDQPQAEQAARVMQQELLVRNSLNV